MQKAGFLMTRLIWAIRKLSLGFRPPADTNLLFRINEVEKFLLHVVQTYKHVHVVLYEQRREKTGFLHLCENKDADQLRGNREADQRFFFATSLYFLNPRFQASSHLLCLHSPVCVGPGRKPQRPVFSQRGSYIE